MVLKKAVFISLISIFAGTLQNFGQTFSNQIGLGWYAELPNLHSLKLSYIYDTNKRFQFESSASFSYDINPDHDRYGIDIFPTVNVYIKKRTENSRRFFITGTIGPYFQYYTRDYNLFLGTPLETPYERYAVGILTGFNINWNFTNRFSFVLNYKIGGSYYFHYGRECTGIFFEECYNESPYVKLQSTGFLYLNIFYKFNLRKNN